MFSGSSYRILTCFSFCFNVPSLVYVLYFYSVFLVVHSIYFSFICCCFLVLYCNQNIRNSVCTHLPKSFLFSCRLQICIILKHTVSFCVVKWSGGTKFLVMSKCLSVAVTILTCSKVPSYIDPPVHIERIFMHNFIWSAFTTNYV